MNKFVNYAFCLLFLVVPFVFSTRSLDPVLLPQLLVLQAALLVLWLVPGYAHVRSLPPVSFRVLRLWIVPTFIVYLLIGMASLLQSINIGESVFELLRLFTFFLFFITVLLLFDLHYLQAYIGVFNIVGFAIAVIAILQFSNLGFTGLPGGGRSYATQGNQNILATSLLLIVPFTLMGRRLSQKPMMRYFSTVNFLLIVFCLVVTMIRAAWLGLIVSGIAAAVLYYLLMRRSRAKSVGIPWKKIVYGAFILFFVVLLAVLSMDTIGTGMFKNIALVQRFGSIFDIHHESVNERIQVWKKTLEMVEDYPILGVGLANWRILFPKYGLKYTSGRWGTVQFQRPHNDFLWILSEMGVLGLLAFLAVVGFAVFYVFKVLSQKKDTLVDYVVLFSFMGMTAYLVNSFFCYSRERIFPLLMFHLFLAVIAKSYYSRKNEANADRIPVARKYRPLIFTVFLCLYALLVLGFYKTYRRFRAEKIVRVARHQYDGGDWEGVIASTSKVIDLGYALDPVASPVHWYRGIGHFYRKDYKKALADFKTAHRMHPYHFMVLDNLAASYEMLGDHEHAIEYYRTAQKLLPGFHQTRVNLGVVYFNAQRYAEARDVFLKSGGYPDQERIRSFLRTTEEMLEASGKLQPETFPYWDDFERDRIGEDWATHSGMTIEDGALTCGSDDPVWDYAAILKKFPNPYAASIVWGALADNEGIGQGGFCVMADRPDPNGDGYLVWMHDGEIDLWTVENGRPGRPVQMTRAFTGQVTAGDTVKVVFGCDEMGRHFDLYVNGETAGRVSDGRPTSSEPWFVGVCLRGGAENDVDAFGVEIDTGDARLSDE